MNSNQSSLNLKYFIAVLVFMTGVIFSLSISEKGISGFIYFIDFITIILLLIFTIPMLILSGLGKSFMKAFSMIFIRNQTFERIEVQKSLEAVKLTSRLLINSSIFTALCNCVLILVSLSSIEQLGPNISVAILSIIYPLFLEMFLLPMRSRLHTMLLSDEEQITS